MALFNKILTELWEATTLIMSVSLLHLFFSISFMSCVLLSITFFTSFIWWAYLDFNFYISKINELSIMTLLFNRKKLLVIWKKFDYNENEINSSNFLWSNDDFLLCISSYITHIRFSMNMVFTTFIFFELLLLSIIIMIFILSKNSSWCFSGCYV